MKLSIMGTTELEFLLLASVPPPHKNIGSNSSCDCKLNSDRTLGISVNSAGQVNSASFVEELFRRSQRQIVHHPLVLSQKPFYSGDFSTGSSL